MISPWKRIHLIGNDIFILYCIMLMQFWKYLYILCIQFFSSCMQNKCFLGVKKKKSQNYNSFFFKFQLLNKLKKPARISKKSAININTKWILFWIQYDGNKYRKNRIFGELESLIFFNSVYRRQYLKIK